MLFYQSSFLSSSASAVEAYVRYFFTFPPFSQIKLHFVKLAARSDDHQCVLLRPEGASRGGVVPQPVLGQRPLGIEVIRHKPFPDIGWTLGLALVPSRSEGPDVDCPFGRGGRNVSVRGRESNGVYLSSVAPSSQLLLQELPAGVLLGSCPPYPYQGALLRSRSDEAAVEGESDARQTA